jgi:hypothetical protein
MFTIFILVALLTIDIAQLGNLNVAPDIWEYKFIIFLALPRSIVPLDQLPVAFTLNFLAACYHGPSRIDFYPRRPAILPMHHFQIH